MITKVFAVYDSKTLSFGVPFFMPTVGSAVRGFSDLSNDSNSTVNRHPSDFILYQIGNFDDEKGILIALSPHVHLGVALDFISRPPKSSIVDEAIRHPLATNSELEAH